MADAAAAFEHLANSRRAFEGLKTEMQEFSIAVASNATGVQIEKARYRSHEYLDLYFDAQIAVIATQKGK